MTSSKIHRLVIVTAMVCSAQVWAETAVLAESAKGNVSNGQSIYKRHCVGCHGIEGKGDGYRLLGPDPANLTARSTKEKPDSTLLKTIHEGKPNMPSWKVRLSGQDSQDVLAYIRTLAR
jgi:mono/diheme cytochrome c family protein